MTIILIVIGIIVLGVIIYSVLNRVDKTKKNKILKQKSIDLSPKDVLNLTEQLDLVPIGTRVHLGIFSGRNVPMTLGCKKTFIKEYFYRLLVEDDGALKHLFVHRGMGDYCILNRDYPVFFNDQDQFPIEEISPNVIPINKKDDSKDFDEFHTAHYP